MKLFNYQKLFGAFSDAYQFIMLDQEPSDRQEKKMLDEANKLLNAGWTRRMAFLERRQTEGEEVNLEAERAAFFPKVVDGKLAVPLQYVQDFMFRKIAALQNNTSIHNTQEVTELKEVFDEYGVVLYPSFTGLVFDFINWSAKDRQKPKLLVHAKDANGEEVCIRFEAAGELCQKFMLALLHLPVKQGTVFDLKVEAVDPAIARNKAGGKVEVGKYVNHNLVVKVGNASHTGHPPKGQKFLQKPTIEYMETLFKQAQMETEQRAAKAAA
ncbi:hypothetical protein G3A43_07645 [Paraburkholderia aspalathi]|nr:hypothetical protein [Paraburkholderia aspalathi]MBK3780128.1 hypothetical protein [Paraburkholderia aspalathi]